MKSIVNDYCIRMFADSGNNLRPYLNSVVLRDGYLYATNTHMLGKIKSELCVRHYDPDPKFPNAEKLFQEHQCSDRKTFAVADLFNELMKIECCFKPKMVECDTCDGQGMCVCDHCNSSYDCKECDGSGSVPGKELELTSEHDCILFSRKYSLQYLDLIIRTAVYTGVKEIEISNAPDSGGTVFTVGDFLILLMPRI